MPRPTKCRRVCYFPEVLEFSPTGAVSGEPIVLTIDELETIRLIDKENLSQEECGAQLGVGRTTAQKIYETARKKIADALVLGFALKIEGGEFQLCSGSTDFCYKKDCIKRQIQKEYKTEKGANIMRIAVTFEDEEIGYSFWLQRITAAYHMRRAIGLTDRADNDTFRLIHGEGDNLPGLVVDYYAGVAVVQFHSVGMYLERENITRALLETLGDRLTAIYDKSESTLPYKAAIDPHNGYLYGKADHFIAQENGLKFNVDWLEGQKTGFFIDQRENRHLLEKYAGNKQVLNMFCYTGGFSFYAMRGGARSVHSVDVSTRAIELAKQNVALNFPGDRRHEAFAEDQKVKTEAAERLTVSLRTVRWGGTLLPAGQ